MKGSSEILLLFLEWGPVLVRKMMSGCMKGRDYGLESIFHLLSSQLPFLFVAKHCLSCHNGFPQDGLTSGQFLPTMVSSQQQFFITKSCHILLSVNRNARTNGSPLQFVMN